MKKINSMIWFLFFIHLLSAFDGPVAIFNSQTRCHNLSVPNRSLTFALCFQRGSNKQHLNNLHTAPTFCSSIGANLIDLQTISSDIFQFLFQSLTKLLNTKNSQIDLPEPNFLWLTSNWTETSIAEQFWCPQQCRSKTRADKYLILRTRCQYENHSQPCLTTRANHWDRAPIVCVLNQTIDGKENVNVSSSVVSKDSNQTKVSYDSDSCLIVRSITHQYTFCFRRQICPQSHTSAFCTTKPLAQQVCQRDKNQSSLLTIETDDEYRLINGIISKYSHETLWNSQGHTTSKYNVRAQWMWINGIRVANETYQWDSSDLNSTTISDHYWCERMNNCSGGRGRDHLVINIVCQTIDKQQQQICLASRRHSEPGPFICKRRLTDKEDPLPNNTIVVGTNKIIAPIPVVPAYEINSTSIYYDEDHCLTVQTRTHLYAFCLRRQACSARQAFCTKWHQAEKQCQVSKAHSQLLTIDNEEERHLVTHILDEYIHETRLTFNGSSYRYFFPADFLWIDGVVQKDTNTTYQWKEGQEIIPQHLWCPRNECTWHPRDHVMLNLLCRQNRTSICLGTRQGWKLAPYVCKRSRTPDHCPIPFDRIQSVHPSEMLVITVNRTISLIKCKHPDYHTEIRVQYQCDRDSNQWTLTYENDNFTCPGYEIPPTATSLTAISISSALISTSLSTPESPTSPAIPTPNYYKENDCSNEDFAPFLAALPTQSRYISQQDFQSISPPSYYDRRLTCYFNHSIQITYRCHRSTRQWIYIYGRSQEFRFCYPPCSNEERSDLLDKYFSRDQQSQIRLIRRPDQNSFRLSCFNQHTRQRTGIVYRCGTMSITTRQWFKLHTCLDSGPPNSEELPIATVVLAVDEKPPTCPAPVLPNTPCAFQPGHYIYDTNGCAKKICPSTSDLCRTIRCPPDRICRVIPCKSCVQNGYLQAVCEYPSQLSLCEMESQLSSLKDEQSIGVWEEQTVALVRQYAQNQRQRLLSPWLRLTKN